MVRRTLVLAMVLGIALIAAPVNATYPGASGRLAFSSVMDDGWHVFSVAPDGADLVQLTDFDRATDLPVWSPDGKRVLVETRVDGNWDLYMMRADGSRRRSFMRTRKNESSAAWSPDGKRVAFVRPVRKLAQIFVAPAKGEGRARLITDLPTGVLHLEWSPKGNRIAFAAFGEQSGLDISTIRPDGSAVRRVTSGAAARLPSWHPSGTKLVYASYRDVSSEPCNPPALGFGDMHGLCNWDLFEYDFVTGSETQLTDHPGWDDAAVWSPDGKQIAFVSDRDAPGTEIDIYVMDADGSNVSRIVQQEGFEWALDWQPVPQ